MDKQLLDVNEVSEFLGYKPLYILDLVRAGKIPHSKPLGKNGKTFFIKEDIIKWVRKNSRPVEE